MLSAARLHSAIPDALASAACRNHRITEQVMVGTHGQLKNLYSKRVLKFQAVRIVVFDEADEMLKVLLRP